tara:strand:+ start:842 stop:2641 length:1800 start_codon:yes stop_codon:yes gene_type:complete
MAGGLLNLIAYGNQNVIIHGDPQKTFFKVTYAKHTNFGLQKFRIDYSGLRYLQPTTETKLSFKIPRYGDLLMDTYLAVKMPTIWSPIVADGDSNIFTYEFKWIPDLGTQMIKEITIYIGGQVIQHYTGDYLKCMIDRDYNTERKEVFNRMSGNIPEMYAPEKHCKDIIFKYDTYPNCLYKQASDGSDIVPHPSIEGRYIYIPINAFWCMNSKMALPLIGLEYTDVEIEIVIRPIKELYTIVNTDRDISGTYVDEQLEETDDTISQLIGNRPYVRTAPDYNNPLHQLKWFLYPPSRRLIDIDKEEEVGNFTRPQREAWESQREDWNADVHLISTYAFLSDDESELFTNSTQEYLFKDIKEHKYLGVRGTKKVELETSSLVSGWMFHFSRDDVDKFNEWSNYTNHNYNTNINKFRYIYSSNTPGDPLNDLDINGITNNIDPFWNNSNVSDVLAPLPMVTNSYNTLSKKSVLESMGILLDGKYRENVFEEGIFNYLEKNRNTGITNDGLYCYNFGINTNNFDTQPSGAINLSKFKKVEFEFTTLEPPKSLKHQVNVLCAGDTTIGPIEIDKLFKYNYDLHIYEERYNILVINNGMAELKFSR